MPDLKQFAKCLVVKEKMLKIGIERNLVHPVRGETSAEPPTEMLNTLARLADSSMSQNRSAGIISTHVTIVNEHCGASLRTPRLVAELARVQNSPGKAELWRVQLRKIYRLSASHRTPRSGVPHF